MSLTTDIRNNSHAAFAEAYQRLHIHVFRFLFGKTRTRDSAADLTQQCFIRLWDFRHTLSDDHPLEKQVFIIARSLLINYLKKEAVQKQLKAGYKTTLEEESATTHDAALFETSHGLNQKLKQLSPVRRQVITLKLMEGYSNKEIAGQLSISVKTVEDHVTKAFRILRNKDIHVVSFLVCMLVNQSLR